MIINIPLQIDDEMINSVIAADYQEKIEQNLTKQVEAAIKSRSPYYSRTIENGLSYMADQAVDSFINDPENKEIILERAAYKLAERLARTKKAKEILEDIKYEHDS